MKYSASIVVDGRMDVEVEADSFFEAMTKALESFAFADIAELEVVDSNVQTIRCLETGEEKSFDF